ncbi:MAG: MBG domain-containing protein [Bacteroidota bacterium]|nr:MBG domain-containing protein [Bacteroidota bacterium]
MKNRINTATVTGVLRAFSLMLLLLVISFNSGSYARAAAARVVADPLKAATDIVDPGVDVSLNVSSTSVAVAGLPASKNTVDITSNTTWTASSDNSWLAVSPATGAGNGQLTFTAKQNPTTAARVATVSVWGTGLAVAKKITVTQAAGDGSIVVTNGNLTTTLTDAGITIADITDLKIKGTIDARDFKAMRDDMPLLAVLDLSGATIVAYTGDKGTAGTTDITYPDNEIPQFAFSDPVYQTGKKTLSSIKMPLSTTSIGSYAFIDCSGLTGKLDIPSLVTIIGGQAFSNCIGLSGTLTIPSLVTTIGENTFHGCNGLTGTLILPPSVTTINDYVFSGCSGFTSIIFPTAITSIGGGAFSGCSGLKAIYVNQADPTKITLGAYVFDGVDKAGCKLYVPLVSKDLYKAADQWKDFYRVSVVNELTSFTATTNSYTQIDLAATANANNDQIVVVYNNTGIFTSPVNSASSVKVGDAFANGTILYIGSAAGLINHTGLAKGTTYYYDAFVYDGSTNYSFGTIVNASTLAFDNPAAFTATPASGTQLNLSSTANASGDQIVVVYNNTGVFSSPPDGTAFGHSGDSFAGGTILYQGDAGQLTNHTGLLKGTEYYYKAFSYNSAYLYSNGATAHARTTVGEPANQPANFTSGPVTSSSIPLKWTPAVAGLQLPDGYLVKLSLSKTVVDPVDGTDPDDVLTVTNGTANMKVTPGTASSAVSFSGLQAGTMYNYKIYSYTNAGSLIDFNTTSAPVMQQATMPVAILAQTYKLTGTTTADITWTSPAGYVAGNHTTLVFVKAASAITTGTPTNAPSGYTANAAYASGTPFQLDAAAYCVYKGDGTTVSVTGLIPGTPYYVSIYTVVDAVNSDGTNSYSIAATLANGVAGIANITALVPNGLVDKVISNDNYTYIGGEFYTVGQTSGHGAKLSTTSAAPDMSFAKANGAIYSCVPDGNGGWYIGGDFTHVGTVTRNHLAQLNSAGEVTAWDPNANDRVQCIALSGPDIYVGGYFTSIGGVARNKIAKLNNADGAPDVEWNPNSDGPSSIINTIAINGTDILVGGYFSTMGGQIRNNIAKLNNTDGTADPAWKPDADGQVLCIAVNKGEIYTGGSFYSIGGENRKYIAKLNNTDGHADIDWQPETTNQIKAIAFSNEEVYIGGDNNSWTLVVNGVTTSNICVPRIRKVNRTTGDVDATWNLKEINGPVNSLAIIGSDLYAGGDFSSYGGQSVNNLIKLNSTTGEADFSWDPDFDNTVNCIAGDGNNLYVGGNFLTFGGQTRNGLARFNNSDGSLDMNWNPNANKAVSTIALNGNDVYVGGSFDEIGGSSKKGIAKLNNTNGAVDESWDALGDGNVNSIVMTGSDLIVGGYFQFIGGQERWCVAKLNTINGDADHTWSANADGEVYSLAVNKNDLYVGGFFENIGGVARNYLAKLDIPTGIVNPIWNPNASYPVCSVAVSGNNIFAGGYFDNIGGQPRNTLAKLNNTTGDADNAWNPDVSGPPMGGVSPQKVSSISTAGSLKSRVDAFMGRTVNKPVTLNPVTQLQKVAASTAGVGGVLLTIVPNGPDLYVGGIFDAMGGYTRNGLAKMNISDAKVDPYWNPAIDGTGVASISVQGENLYTGGQFTTIYGQFQPNLAKLKLPAPAVEYYNILSGATATLSAAANSTATVDVSSNTTWTATIDPAANWLTVSPDVLVSGNATLTFNAQANPGGVRTALVTITSNEGIAPQTITVTQKAYSQLAVPNLVLAWSKVYDKTLSAAITVGDVTGVAPGDKVTVKAAASYVDANVGKEKTIHVTFALEGVDAGKYTAPVDYDVNTGVITPRPVTITPDAGQTKVYGTADPTFTYTVSEALQSGDSYSGALSRLAGKDVSTYAYTTGTLSAGDNYVLTLGGSNTFAITARPVTITPDAGQSKVYGTADPTFTYTASEALQAGDSYSGALSRLAGKDVSTYAYTPGTLSAGVNYALTLGGSNTFAITARPLTVTPDAGQTKVYGNADPAFTYTASEALQAGDSYSGALSRASGNNVSTYAYTLGTLSAGSNYALTLGGSNTLAITARPVTITADAKSKTYGDADPVLTAQVTGGTVVTGDDPTGSLTREAGENKGTYAIHQGTYSFGPNYAQTFAGNDLTVEKRVLTVTAVPDSKTYDGNSSSAVKPSLEGLVSGDAVNPPAVQAFDNPNVGATHTLIVSGLTIKNGTTDVTENYTINYVPSSADGAITAKQVSVADPTITARKVYDGSASATVVEGLLSDLAAGDIGKVTLNATASYSDASAGTGKTITVTYTLSGPSAGNYTAPADYTYSVDAAEIVRKQLAIAPPTAVTVKVVDGNTSAVLTSIGDLQGVEPADIGNVRVMATAGYDNAGAGTNKTITVVYTLTGSASGNYIAPADYVIHGAEISDNITLSPLASPSPGCENTELELAYTVLTGAPTRYKLTFNDAALAGGVKNVSYSNLPTSLNNGTLSFALPNGMPDGTYQGTLQMKNDQGTESPGYTFNFTVNISSAYIIPKFKDVVLCDNSSNRFTGYQWYKDGVAVNGATDQVYCDPEGLVGSYSLEVTTTDGQTLFSCPKVLNIPLPQKVSVYPSPVKENEICTVKLTGMIDEELEGAELTVYTMQGVRIYRSAKVEKLNKISLPAADGIYAGHVITAKGKEFLFKIVVVK